MLKPAPPPLRHTCRQPELRDVFPPGMPWVPTHVWGAHGEPVQIVFSGGRYFYRFERRGAGSGAIGSDTYFARTLKGEYL